MIRALLVGMLVLVLAHPAQAQAVSTGYARIEHSIVKVWGLDAHGAPLASSTGLVVASDSATSTILTTPRAVKSAAAILVDVNSTVNNLAATVSATTPDLVLLTVKQGNLPVATFSPRPVAVGDRIAAAGYLTTDVAGALVQHLLFPGTISALLNSDKLFEFDSLAIADGLGGSPIFDPTTGNVFGIVATRNTDAGSSGGYAISARLVVTAFLSAQHVQVAGPASSATPSSAPPALPARLGHVPSNAQPWASLNGLPGAFWLWYNDGYDASGYQTVDVYVFNDYAQTMYFFPELRFSLDGKPYDIYFNDQRIYSVASGGTQEFHLKFPIPHALADIAASVHDVRFGTDTGPLLLPH